MPYVSMMYMHWIASSAGGTSTTVADASTIATTGADVDGIVAIGISAAIVGALMAFGASRRPEDMDDVLTD